MTRRLLYSYIKSNLFTRRKTKNKKQNEIRMIKYWTREIRSWRRDTWLKDKSRWFNHHDSYLDMIINIISWQMIYKAKSSFCNKNFETYRYIFQLLFFYFRFLRIKNLDDYFHLELNTITKKKFVFLCVFRLCESFLHVVDVSCMWMIRFWSRNSCKYCCWLSKSTLTKQSLFWFELLLMSRSEDELIQSLDFN